MMATAAPDQPALKYFGGKWALAPWIIENFPPHRVYVEPFGGGASVLLRKPKAWSEVYNDLDGEVVNFFRVLQDQDESARLERAVKYTPYSRKEFEKAHEVTDDAVERAKRTMVRSFMGFGSNGISSKTGFKTVSTNSGSNQWNQWASRWENIAGLSRRLMGVVIENKDAKEVMAQQDSPDTLHFVDPPYVTGTRVIKDGYKFEMTDADHESLCTFLSTLKGMVILCGYPNAIYDSLKWECRQREAHADGASDRIECLWLNPAASKQQMQTSFL